MLFLPITAMVRRMVFVFARVAIGLIGWLGRRHYSCASCGPFNQLIQFTPIKPHASTLWAVVNLNALAFGHQKT